MQAHLRPAKIDKELEKLNKHLAKFHIEVTPKEISAPTKFHNEAAALVKKIVGLDKSASGITWAPALVRFGAVGLSAEAAGVSITPSFLDISPKVADIEMLGACPSCHLAQLTPVLKSAFRLCRGPAQ